MTMSGDDKLTSIGVLSNFRSQEIIAWQIGIRKVEFDLLLNGIEKLLVCGNCSGGRCVVGHFFLYVCYYYYYYFVFLRGERVRESGVWGVVGCVSGKNAKILLKLDNK